MVRPSAPSWSGDEHTMYEFHLHLSNSSRRVRMIRPSIACSLVNPNRKSTSVNVMPHCRKRAGISGNTFLVRCFRSSCKSRKVELINAPSSLLCGISGSLVEVYDLHVLQYELSERRGQKIPLPGGITADTVNYLKAACIVDGE